MVNIETQHCIEQHMQTLFADKVLRIILFYNIIHQLVTSKTVKYSY